MGDEKMDGWIGEKRSKNDWKIDGWKIYAELYIASKCCLSVEK